MDRRRISHKELYEILKIVESAEDVLDFHLKYGDVEIRLSRFGAAQAGETHEPGTARTPKPLQGEPAQAESPMESPALRDELAGSSGMIAVKSSMVGTFHRAPSPGAAPFVEVGHAVKPDTVLCIIEVIRLMNSIPAGTTGIVREILVNDAQPVEFAQTLFIIEPTP